MADIFVKNQWLENVGLPNIKISKKFNLGTFVKLLETISRNITQMKDE